MSSLSFDFPLVPAGWYYAAPVEMLRRPVEVTLGEREYVAFATDRQLHVLDGRCPHFHAHLARGKVVGDCLECPLHGWRMRGDGMVVRTVPDATSDEGSVPMLRVASYPTARLGGHLFFHVGGGVPQTPPFFAGVTPDELISAPPFSFDAEMPWWMVSANGFDVQHFRTAHDRRLVSDPHVTREDDVFESEAAFDIVGRSWRDSVVALLAGTRTEMTVRNAGGTLIQVTSRFRRTTTYGLVSIQPRSTTRSHVRTIVWKHPRRGALRAFDALDVRIRASFIRAFIGPDIVAGAGIRYDARRATAADALLTRYLTWLARRSRDGEQPSLDDSLSSS